MLKKEKRNNKQITSLRGEAVGFDAAIYEQSASLRGAAKRRDAAIYEQFASL